MDIIIKMRLEALKNNLSKILCLLESVKDRQKEIRTLSENLTKAQGYIFEVEYNVNYVLDTSRNQHSQAKMDARLGRILEIAQKNVGGLTEALQKAAQSINEIQTRSTPIDKTFERTVKNDLNQKMSPWFEAINAHLKALDAAKPEEVNQLIEKAWDDYTDIMSKKSQLIFTDYVEFLSGLALRDAGLDEGICRIADELMRSCGSVGITQWSALTIPASKEASTLARSIRMRFPEWTIWAVPLTAHELGQVVIREPGTPDFEAYVKKESGNAKTKQQHMRVLLADAFATYVMGPAYACSVVLLRLNPREDDKDKPDKGIYPPDAKRAHVVLSMLEKMYTRDSLVNKPYGDIIAKIRAAWDAALVTGGGVPGAPLSADVRQLDRWTDHVLDELSRAYEKGLYEGTLWTNTREALELLLSGKDPTDKLNGREEWRDVLNAAWACRINSVDDSQMIAKNAEELWRRIEKKKSETSDRQVSASGYPANIVPRIHGDKKS